jgi:hypothetical protein
VFFHPIRATPGRACDHKVPLIPGTSPIQSRPYRYAPSLKDEIENQVADMLEAGLIQPSTGSFSSPVHLVKKKDNMWQFCIDYKALNAITMKSKFPLPVIDELMDELSGSCWFSMLDLRAGYHHIRLAPEEEYKIAFHTHSGHYEFKVMPFGLCGVPNTFQSDMNVTLAPLLRKSSLVFFDDILIYSTTLDDHVKHLEQVLQLLAQDNWHAKYSKFSFTKRQIDYLGACHLRRRGIY